MLHRQLMLWGYKKRERHVIPWDSKWRVTSRETHRIVCRFLWFTIKNGGKRMKG